MHVLWHNPKLLLLLGNSNFMAAAKAPFFLVRSPFGDLLSPHGATDVCALRAWWSPRKHVVGVSFLNPLMLPLPMHRIKEAGDGACDPSHGIITFGFKIHSLNLVVLETRICSLRQEASSLLTCALRFNRNLRPLNFYGHEDYLKSCEESTISSLQIISLIDEGFTKS